MPGIRYKGQIYSGAASVGNADDININDGSGQVTDTQTIISRILGDFAEIESSSTASKAYDVGEYLVLNGYFYRTVIPIASGDELIVGNNIDETTIDAELRDARSKPRWVELTSIKSSRMTAGTYQNISTRGRTFDEFCLIRLNTSIYEEGLPDYGGITISYEELRLAASAGVVVAKFDAEYSFAVRYVNDTTLSVAFTGTTGTNKCLSVHGIL